MNLVSTSIIGFVQFVLELVIALYLLRMVAIKTHHTAAGQGLGALVF